MNKPIRVNMFNSTSADIHTLKQHLSILSNGLLQLLMHQFPSDDTQVQQSIGFLRYFVSEYLGDKEANSKEDAGDVSSKAKLLSRQTSLQQGPLQVLAQAWQLSEMEVSLLVLSGMIHEHEAFGDIFKRLHPERKPFVTPSLWLHIFGNHSQLREELSNVLMNSLLVKRGLLNLTQLASVYASSLVCEAQDYLALKTGRVHGINQAPDHQWMSGAGLTRWLGSGDVAKAIGAIRQSLNAIIYLLHDDIKTSVNRAKVMLQSNDFTYLHVYLSAETTAEMLQSLFFQALVTQAIPLLEMRGTQKLPLETINQYSGPIVFCTNDLSVRPETRRTIVELPLERLSVDEHQAMWQHFLPVFKKHSRELAMRFSIEPHEAQQRVSMLPPALTSEHSNGEFLAVLKALKVSSSEAMPQGVTRIIPALGWQDLVLPDLQIQDLKGALNRLRWQHRVIDEWRFLHNKRGAKGVRLLFSGPPGTGKTLSAEILAKAIETELLVIDLAGLVSKWIGETEKNLASIFHYAEQTQAVLFFDEADAVFGKRTEVNEANDRYANLETAYLLSRLESYDSIAILATNLRSNIDPAFTRRLDYCIEFKEPNAKERERLWRCHIPKQAPLDSNVDFAVLADLYPLVGGEIKNAAVGGAYRAAELQQNIKQKHFIDAIRRELEKSGKTFREVNSL